MNHGYDTNGWTQVTNEKLVIKFEGAHILARGFGISFLEHPTKGDEAPVYAKVGKTLFNTNDFDIPEKSYAIKLQGLTKKGQQQ